MSWNMFVLGDKYHKQTYFKTSSEYDADYKAKIDALTEALLSKAVSDYVNNKYGGAITCDSSSQIDLR